MSDDLVMFEKILHPMDAIMQMGDFFAKSGMFGCEKTEQGMVLASVCILERQTPLKLLQKYHLIKGRLSMRSDAMLAGYMERGGKIKWLQFDLDGASANFFFDGVETKIEYMVADAEKAGLLPAKAFSGWDKDRGAMLRSRLISKAVRMLCPGVIAGAATPEEIEDWSTAQTPPRPAATVTATVTTSDPQATVVDIAALKPIKDLFQQATVVDPDPAAANGNILALPWELVQEACAAQADAVLAWLRKWNWIGLEQGWKDIKESDCTRIIARPEAFIKNVLSGKGPKDGVRK